MNEIYFPHGVWMHIRSYMPIWKNAYNRVIAKIPRYNSIILSTIYTSTTKSIRFKKEVRRHHFIGKHLSETCKDYLSQNVFLVTYVLISSSYLLNPDDPILKSGGFGQFEL